jgi:N-acetylglucosaminylphosphatidylinositol deacetylase
MIWLIINSILVIFIISNFILYFICLIFEKKISQKISSKNICIIIAHPDDECMFFGPIIRQLNSFSNRFYILCMTNGNFYGKGDLRATELESSCQTLISNKNLIDLKLVNESQLPDHPKYEWNKNLCTKIINDYVKSNSIDMIVSFDKDGISSHLNHCFLYKILKSIDLNNQVDIYSLETVGIIRKYSFGFDLITTFLFNSASDKRLIAISSPSDYLITFRAMMKHQTQLMWFRWIYIITSRYMIINSLKKISK